MKNKIMAIVPYIIIVLCVTYIFALTTRTIVVASTDGTSMMPTLNGEEVVIGITDEFVELQRGDIVTIHTPEKNYIKRVIGLPGETIEFKNKSVKINGEVMDEPYVSYDGLGLPEREQEAIQKMSIEYKNSTVTLGEDEYFVMGDNRIVSNDSRNFGPVTAKEITSKVVYYK